MRRRARPDALAPAAAECAPWRVSDIFPCLVALRHLDHISRFLFPVSYLLFEGEQHGFRKAENVITALEAELVFFGDMLGFTPAGDVPDIDIRR